jgi:hypothetical protein
MKKLRMILVFALVAAMLAACGGAPAETTAPVTEAPTTAPTTVPTEAPTTAPTLPPMEPIVNFWFAEPDGFTALTTGETLSILAGPDGDGSSISIIKLNTPMDFSELTEENFHESLGILGEEGQAPALNAMNPMEIDGYPAYFVDYNMTSNNVTAHYRSYFITDGESTVSFIFADATADGKWAEAYAASVESINLLVEGELLPADTSGLELYDLGCGLSMYAAPGMEALEIEGFAACLADEKNTILVIQDNKAEYGLYGLTAEDYANVYVDGELITGFETDPCGNIATSFLSQGDDGETYFYYAVAKNTADNFYFIQLACDQNAAIAMAGEFAEWCATFAENP